jgi:hypothetical protein
MSSSDSQNSNASIRSAGTRRRRAARRTEKAVARAEDDAEKEQYLQRWDAPRALSREIDRHVGAAREIEPGVTRFLRHTAKKHGARMKALDCRLKSKASLTRKVLEKTAGRSEEEIIAMVGKQNDLLRYTAVIKTAKYTEAVKAIVAELNDNSYSTVHIKNFWRKPGEAADYMGINAVFALPSGASFELQFHTMQSLDTKMQRCHQSYSKFREERSMVKAQYWEEMVRMWSLVPIPSGVSDIGDLVAHQVKLEDALSQLSESERAEIEKVRALERVVAPLCEVVVAHTIKAEQQVTPIMRTLAKQMNFKLHGLDFRVKSSLSMARKAVSKLHAANKTADDLIAMEAEVWCEQRQALRYTVVVDDLDCYTVTVRDILQTLESQFNYQSEFCYNYWEDAEPYNAIRSRLWSSELSAWCFIVFHTQESMEMSEARLTYHQRALGIVFHTATFDEKQTTKTVQALRNDTSWVAKVARMHIPRDVVSIGTLIKSPTTLATITEEGEDSDEEGADGDEMPHADKGCWHHKVCHKPVDTDEDGIAELPANIRLSASEARRAEEAGHLARAAELYASAVRELMKMISEEVPKASDEEWLQAPAERNYLSLLSQTFSLANPRLSECPLVYVSEGFSHLTGYSFDEAVGRSARFLQHQASVRATACLRPNISAALTTNTLLNHPLPTSCAVERVS